MEDAKANGWMVLSEPDIVTATGTTLVLDNDGSRGAPIERPVMCAES